MHPADLLPLVKRRALPLALCALSGLAGGIYYVAVSPPNYVATSRSIVTLPSSRGVSEALAGVQLSGQLLETYAQVAKSREVSQRVVALLGLSKDPEAVRRQLTATTVKGTYLIDITAADRDPQQAAALADAAARAFEEAISRLEEGRTDSIQAQVLDYATVPGKAVSPQPVQDTLLGLVLGLLVGGAVVALVEALDRTVKSPEQVQTLLPAPLLGLVPRRRGGLHLVAATDEASREAEGFRAIRTALSFLDPDRPMQRVLITSPASGEGKSSLAANLAVTLAAAGQHVLAIDADLRRGGLSSLFGVERGVGLSNAIIGNVPLADVIQDWAPRLHVLPAGPLPPNPAELLGSQAMASLLDSLAGQYDVVIVDAPPVLPVTDAVVLATQADAVVLVMRYGRTSRHSVHEAGRRLAVVGAPVAGLVINAVPPSQSHDYYADRTYEPLRSGRSSRDE